MVLRPFVIGDHEFLCRQAARLRAVRQHLRFTVAGDLAPSTSSSRAAALAERLRACQERFAGAACARCPKVSEDATLRKPTTGIAGCCARAASGQAATPPKALMKSRHGELLMLGFEVA